MGHWDPCNIFEELPLTIASPGIVVVVIIIIDITAVVVVAAAAAAAAAALLRLGSTRPS